MLNAEREMPSFEINGVYAMQEEPDSAWEYVKVMDAEPEVSPIKVLRFGDSEFQMIDPARIFAWAGPIPDPVFSEYEMGVDLGAETDGD